MDTSATRVEFIDPHLIIHINHGFSTFSGFGHLSEELDKVYEINNKKYDLYKAIIIDFRHTNLPTSLAISLILSLNALKYNIMIVCNSEVQTIIQLVIGSLIECNNFLGFYHDVASAIRSYDQNFQEASHG